MFDAHHELTRQRCGALAALGLTLAGVPAVLLAAFAQAPFKFTGVLEQVRVEMKPAAIATE